MATTKRREKENEAYLKKRVREHGGLYRKWVSPGRRGVPDDIVIAPCLDPHVQFVEMKAEGKEPEDHQLREHERIRKAGGIVHVFECYEDIDTFFELNCDRSCKNG